MRADGRAFRDDTGPFHPLGHTLFWAIRGEKQDPTRIRQAWAYLKKYKVNFQRVLGDVQWPGLQTDSSWSDYQSAAARMVDAAYDEYGIKTMLTVWGGGTISPARNPMRVADMWVEIIKGRKHKMQYFEGCNEVMLKDLPLLIAITKKLQATGILTAPGYGDVYLGAKTLQKLLAQGGNLASVHIQRNYGDWDWRFVRQSYDVHDWPWPTVSGEPKGPGSSVSACNNPLQLAMDRAVGVMNGAGSYIIHNAAGNTGAVDTQRHRTANIWEMPNIDAVMQAIQGVGALLPDGVENWQFANTQWRPPNPVSPFEAHDYWQQGDGHNGVNKAYSALGPDGRCIQMPCGVKQHVIMTANYPLRDVTVYDPLTVKPVPGFEKLTLAKGGTIDLPGRDDTMTAYIVQAVRR